MQREGGSGTGPSVWRRRGQQENLSQGPEQGEQRQEEGGGRVQAGHGLDGGREAMASGKCSTGNGIYNMRPTHTGLQTKGK